MSPSSNIPGDVDASPRDLEVVAPEIPPRAVRVLFLVVMALLGGSWGEASRMRYVGPLAAVGLVLIWARRRPTRADAELYAAFMGTHLLVLASAVIFQDGQQILFHLMLPFLVFPFIQSFLAAYGMDWSGLVGLALGIVPYMLPAVFGLGDVAVQDIFGAGRPARFVGLTGDPNYTALGLMPVLAATLLLIMRVRRIARPLLLGPTGAVMAAVVATGSRAGMGAMLLVLAIFLVVNARHAGWKAIVAALGVGGAIIYGVAVGMSDYVGFFFTRIDHGSALFADDRYAVWASALEEVLGSPPLNYVPEDAMISRYGMVVHNFLLDLGLTFGSAVMLVHAVAWVIGGATLGVRCWRAFVDGRRLATSPYVAGLMLPLPIVVIASTLTVGNGTLYWLSYVLLWSIAWSPRVPDAEPATGGHAPPEGPPGLAAAHGDAR